MLMWQGLKNIYHLIIAVLANLWFKFPSKKLIVIGVTGTDGKTTTVSIIYHVLNTAGRTSMISSVGAIINGKAYDIGFHVTTPSSWQIQKILKKAEKTGGEYMVVEVTSHALDQYRVWGIDFKVCALTNVTHEHLDYHKTYKNYVNTKAKLLKMAKKAFVVNGDDGSYSILSRNKISDAKKITYGIKNNEEITPKSFPFKSKLLGEFNKYNVLAAVGVCKAIGISDKDIRKGIETFQAPIGREEIVYKGNFTIMIDFAHTPNALEQILSSIRPKIKGKLIHVFGSAGERDYKKRPQMGNISSKYSDIIILTAEDPRLESVDKIMSEIEKGVDKAKFDPKNCYKIADRQEAINKAILLAKDGDFILLTGKAHEKSMNLGSGEQPWSEYEAVKKALDLQNK